MSDTQKKSSNFVAQQSCLGNCRVSIGKQSQNKYNYQ